MSIDVWLREDSRIASTIKRAVLLIEVGQPDQAADELRQFLADEADNDDDDAVELIKDLFHDNMTANVCPMWKKAGIIDVLYVDADCSAASMIEPLEAGLSIMLADKEGFEKLNPKNGWGSYKTAVRFLKDLITACKEYPEAVYHRW